MATPSTLVLTLVFCSSVFGADTHSKEDQALRQTGMADPALIVAWNQIVNEVAFNEDQFLTFKGVRAHAMMHIAIHDALNTVTPLYGRFACHAGGNPFAHPIAAAAQAAHDVVLSQYPSHQEALTTALGSSLSQVPDTPGKVLGIALGKQCAAAIIQARSGDGWDFTGSYSFVAAPGAYQTTPPFEGFVLQPGFRFARPFGLLAPFQFRPGPPPALTSPEYAAAFQEVKDYGRVDSLFRTIEQSRYAIWWMEFAEGSVNRLARQLAIQHRTHLWRTARMFALLNMSLFDSYVAVWDSKYHYNHWRPYTAIREVAADGNPATTPDTTWEPLRTTPPFPEYVSAHATGCSAAFETLKHTYGDTLSFTMRTTTAPPELPVRTFVNFTAAAAECADSRVRLGWHFRYATEAGSELGRTVAGWLDQNQLVFRGAH
jgi:PAP2 superfamily protein